MIRFNNDISVDNLFKMVVPNIGDYDRILINNDSDKWNDTNCIISMNNDNYRPYNEEPLIIVIDTECILHHTIIPGEEFSVYEFLDLLYKWYKQGRCVHLIRCFKNKNDIIMNKYCMHGLINFE